MKYRVTRTELDALAAAAKSGDRQAFEQLISATIGLYYHLARRTPAKWRDDVVYASILHTYRVLKGYDHGQGWLNYAGKAIERFQRQYFARISGPVTVASERVYIRHARMPEQAQGIVDPSAFRHHSARDYHCDTVGELANHQDLCQLRELLPRFDQREQDAVLMEMADFCAKYDVSRQRFHQIRKETITILRHYME